MLPSLRDLADMCRLLLSLILCPLGWHKWADIRADMQPDGRRYWCYCRYCAKERAFTKPRQNAPF